MVILIPHGMLYYWTSTLTLFLRHPVHGATFQDFENSILLEMKVRGWDGNESTDHIQWTFTGALFYSIIVITTIGMWITILTLLQQSQLAN